MGRPVHTKDGIKLCRFGGLSGVPQVHRDAPTCNGIHAFVWPFVEMFLLGGKPSPNKNRRGDRFKDAYRVFFHKGPLYCRFDIPNAPETDSGWTLTDDHELFEVVLRDVLAARKSNGARPGSFPNPYASRFPRHREVQPSDSLGGGGSTYSRDCFEVFVPRGAR